MSKYEEEGRRKGGGKEERVEGRRKGWREEGSGGERSEKLEG